MKKIFFLARFLTFAFLFFTGCSQSSNSEFQNLNPDPNGDPWIAGGGKILSEEENAKIPELKSVFFNKNNGLTKSIHGSIPSAVDNTLKKYFRPIFTQYGGSCAQASGVGYNFTYEINRVRNLDASSEENQYAPFYTYNFLNAGSDMGSGASAAWDVIKDNGAMNITEYGGQYNESLSGDNIFKYWVNGYNKYYNAMKNRVMGYYRIDVNTPDGINLLKSYLYNNIAGDGSGGIVNFSVLITGSSIKKIPSDSPEEGKNIIIDWGNDGAHAMVFAGYNDDIKYDYNGDGKYTNDLDINGDGIVDVRDWEKGAVLVVNSWGKYWCDNGKAYVMYRLLHDIKSVYLVSPKENYTPQLTMKVKIKHSNRSALTILAGISANENSATPDVTKEFYAFKNNGGKNPIAGINDEAIEIGLDISDLLNYADINQNCKIFLKVIEKENSYYGDDNGEGEIESFSIIDYSGNTPEEIICSESNVPIEDSSVTLLSVNKSFAVVPVKNLNAAANNDGNIILSWTDNSQNVESYNIYRNGIYIGNTQEKNYIDSTLIKGNEYKYYIASIINNKELGNSNIIKVSNNITNLPKTLPYFENFENMMLRDQGKNISSILPYGWQNINDKWLIYDMYGFTTWGLTSNDQDENSLSVISPSIDLNSGDSSEELILNFDWYDSFSSEKIMYVEVSIDNGDTWEIISEIRDSERVLNDPNRAFMNTKTVSLSPFDGKIIKLRFRDETTKSCDYCSKPMILIDNVLISRGNNSKIIVNKDDIPFGDVKIFKTDQKSITITNSGNNYLNGTLKLSDEISEAFRIAPSFVSMENGTIYSLDLNNYKELSYRLAPGDSQVFQVIFYPQDAKSYNGNIIITSNDINKPEIKINISGAGDNNFESNFDQMFLRGTFNNWAIDSQMTLVDDYTWEIKNVVFDDKTDMRLKFDVYGDWSLNYGQGNLNTNELVSFGGDIIIPEDDSFAYDIKIFTGSPMTYKIIKVKKLQDFSLIYISNNWVSCEDQKVKGDIYLSYEKIENASKYLIEKQEENEGYSVVGITDQESYSLVNNYFDFNKKISFRIKPIINDLLYFNLNSDTRYIDGNYSEEKIIYTPLDIVKNLSADEITQTSVTLNWNSVENALEYEVYKYSYHYGYGYYEKIATVEELSYTLNNLLPGTEYKFKIKAKNENSSSYNFSDELVIKSEDGVLTTANITFDNDDVIGIKAELNKNGAPYQTLTIYQNYQTKKPYISLNNLTEGSYSLVINEVKDSYKYTGLLDFTIDIDNLNLELECKIIKAPVDNFISIYDNVFIRGTNNSWENTAMVLVADYTWEAKGVHFNSGDADGGPRFKFDILGDWSINYGDTNNDKIAEQGGTDIIVNSNKTYTIKFNDNTKEYSITSDGGDLLFIYENVYIRGTCNNWEKDSMTLVDDYTWEKEMTFQSSSEERFKFDIYGDWSLNFGDSNNDFIADQNGNDIKVEPGKTYIIKFNDNTKVYSYTVK